MDNGPDDTRQRWVLVRPLTAPYRSRVRAQAIAPDGLQFLDPVPVEPEFHQDSLGVLRGLRGAGGLERLVVELDRAADQP